MHLSLFLLPDVDDVMRFVCIVFNFIYLGFSQNNKSGKENTKQIKKKPWSSKKTKAGHLVTGPQNKTNAQFGIS